MNIGHQDCHNKEENALLEYISATLVSGQGEF
jgi:hypothetical protein